MGAAARCIGLAPGHMGLQPRCIGLQPDDGTFGCNLGGMNLKPGYMAYTGLQVGPAARWHASRVQRERGAAAWRVGQRHG